MGFLDNSGDIILDAVLTDAGRQRLARGDGSFRITKFALGDDEINYGLYNKDHPSGSAYFDAELMQTPVFEAFTNNIASLNSRLTSFARTDLLYLPVLKNSAVQGSGNEYADSKVVQNGFILAVDGDSETFLRADGLQYNSETFTKTGILNGVTTGQGASIRIDQGIDNEATFGLELDNDLLETQYLLEMDNRFALLITKDTTSIQPSFIDDDDMASYYVSRDDAATVVTNLGKNENKNSKASQVIAGSTGTKVEFKLRSSMEASTSDFLFKKLGTDVTAKFGNPAGKTVRSILTSVRVTGLTTGNFIDIPLVLIKVN